MKYNKILVYSVLFFIGYALINYVPRGSLSIPVVIETAEVFWTTISLKAILDIFISPVFILIMIYYINTAIVEQPGPDNSELTQQKKDIIRVLFFGAGIILVIGITMHAVTNALNGMLGNPVPPIGDLQVAIYFFDEVLGHKLIHFGIFGFFIGLMVKQYWYRFDPQLATHAKIGLYFWASAIGAVYALIGAEGQAAFDLLVISVVLIVIIVYYIKVKGLRLTENLFTHFVLVFCIGIVVSLVIYGIIIFPDMAPGYPFFPQPPFT